MGVVKLVPETELLSLMPTRRIEVIPKLIRFVIHADEYPTDNDWCALLAIPAKEGYLLQDGHYRALTNRILERPTRVRLLQPEDYRKDPAFFSRDCARILKQRREVRFKFGIETLDDLLTCDAFEKCVAIHSNPDEPPVENLPDGSGKIPIASLGMEEPTAIVRAAAKVYNYFRRIGKYA